MGNWNEIYNGIHEGRQILIEKFSEEPHEYKLITATAKDDNGFCGSDTDGTTSTLITPTAKGAKVEYEYDDLNALKTDLAGDLVGDLEFSHETANKIIDAIKNAE